MVDSGSNLNTAGGSVHLRYMAGLLDLSSRHALALRPRLKSTQHRARPTGLRRSWFSTVRSSAEEPLPQERPCPCCAGWRRRSSPRNASRVLISAALHDGSSSAEPSGTSNNEVYDPLVLDASKVGRPSRPGWYKELYAKVMDTCMRSYEAEIARVKGDLFNHLTQDEKRTGTKNLLEIGVGTGPNVKYYMGGAAGCSDLHVYGVDPNEKMEKYVRKAADAAGLDSTSFRFVQGVAEALPVRDSSMDVVIGTLVMCSVNDLAVALREVKRVLKPGGRYVFIEHVAAQDGSFLRFLQNLLSPFQQLVSDGCHLNRETGKAISETGFSEVEVNNITVPKLYILGPHIYGVAQK